MQVHLDVNERRRSFVQHLYGLHYGLSSDNPQKSSEARQTLARLRRAFAGGRQEAEAYDFVFRHEPPIREQEHWLQLAGLFGLHPHANTARGRSIGEAMRLLGNDRQAIQRRFTQLVSVDRGAVSHYLRQAMQLLRSADVATDYHRLLKDLLALNSSHEDAHRVRLEWARDFHRPDRSAKSREADGIPEPAHAHEDNEAVDV